MVKTASFCWWNQVWWVIMSTTAYIKYFSKSHQHSFKLLFFSCGYSTGGEVKVKEEGRGAQQGKGASLSKMSPSSTPQEQNHVKLSAVSQWKRKTWKEQVHHELSSLWMSYTTRGGGGEENAVTDQVVTRQRRREESEFRRVYDILF